MKLPPLLAIAEGRRVRPRKAVIARPREIVIHMAVAKLLRRFAKPDWKWSHFPAGELRDVKTAAKLKAIGVARGWSDFLIFNPDGRLHALELKRQGETLPDDQELFQVSCIANSVPHAVTRSVEDAAAILTTRGAPRIKIAGGA